MQPSQPAIKKDIINHPFRKIEIVFEAGKTTLTTQDELLLNTYIRLHDLQLDIKNKAEELYRESVTIDQNISFLQKELERVEAVFNTCVEVADKLSAAGYSPEDASLEKMMAAREETVLQLSDYNTKIVSVYEAAQALNKKMNEEADSDEEKLEALYDELTSLAMDHMENSENNAIDAVAFDEQFDQFRGYATSKVEQREALLQSCDSVLINYTNLNNQTTTLYNVWNEFIKRCDLLIAMSDLHDGTMTFNAN